MSTWVDGWVGACGPADGWVGLPRGRAGEEAEAEAGEEAEAEAGDEEAEIGPSGLAKHGLQAYLCAVALRIGQVNLRTRA